MRRFELRNVEHGTFSLIGSENDVQQLLAVRRIHRVCRYKLLVAGPLGLARARRPARTTSATSFLVFLTTFGYGMKLPEPGCEKQNAGDAKHDDPEILLGGR